MSILTITTSPIYFADANPNQPVSVQVEASDQTLKVHEGVGACAIGFDNGFANVHEVGHKGVRCDLVLVKVDENHQTHVVLVEFKVNIQKVTGITKAFCPDTVAQLSNTKDTFFRQDHTVINGHIVPYISLTEGCFKTALYYACILVKFKDLSTNKIQGTIINLNNKGIKFIQITDSNLGKFNSLNLATDLAINNI